MLQQRDTGYWMILEKEYHNTAERYIILKPKFCIDCFSHLRYHRVTVMRLIFHKCAWTVRKSERK